MTEQDIRNILAKGERINVECKLAKNKLPNLWDTYSAFSNTNGGTILLGVEENLKEPELSKRFPIVGVEDVAKIKKEFWDLVNDSNKVSANILSIGDVDSVTIDGVEIVYIHIPRADFTQRPVFINNNVFKGTYRRNHEGDYHCSESVVRMMIRDSNPSGNDDQLLEYFTMDDIDGESLRQYRQMFANWNTDHVWNSLDDKEFLKQLGGYVVDRKEQIEGLSMAGLLMFGKGLPIRERFGNIRMDYIDKTNLIGDQRYSDRITYDGRWENNLFQFIRMVLPKLTKELPRPFKMEGLRRNDDSQQHKAIREAMTNMIIHADLLIDGLLKVVKYDNRFEFSNPGLLQLPVEQIFAGGESKARNQRIQTMFRMIGYGENVGSGFPLIINAWHEKQWADPELIEQVELMQVKLVLSTKTIATSSVPTNINVAQNVAQNFAQDILDKLTERQRSILGMINNNPNITREEMSLCIGKSTKTIERDIEGMRKYMSINFVGAPANGNWVIMAK